MEYSFVVGPTYYNIYNPFNLLQPLQPFQNFFQPNCNLHKNNVVIAYKYTAVVI